MSESKDKTSMLGPSSDGERYELTSPTHLPKASAFLWNKAMMIHMNCRGYAVAQFMQPEPAKYAHAPNLEAKTFMQPEQPYYAHHPGRFFYVKDEENQQVFSAPYEPVRGRLGQLHIFGWKSRHKVVPHKKRPSNNHYTQSGPGRSRGTLEGSGPQQRPQRQTDKPISILSGGLHVVDEPGGLV